jgi:hypothetical protein
MALSKIDGTNLISPTIPVASGGTGVTTSGNIGNLVHIKTITLTSNTTPIQFLNSDADVTFDTTYDTYKFIGNVRYESDGRRTYMRISEDGINLDSTTNNYQADDVASSGGSVSGGDITSTIWYMEDNLSGNATGENMAFEMTLLNNDLGSPRFISIINSINVSNSSALTIRSGRYQQNVRAKGISFFPNGSTNYLSGSTISMYGVKS